MNYQLIKEFTNDIPLEPSIIEEFYSLHNKVIDIKEWYQHSKSSRQNVLNNLKDFINNLSYLVNLNVRVMNKEQKLYLLKIHNILIPENKETTYSCAACRNRMCRRLKEKFEI